MGIEPTSEAWEASILPLYDARSGENGSTKFPRMVDGGVPQPPVIGSPLRGGGSRFHGDESPITTFRAKLMRRRRGPLWPITVAAFIDKLEKEGELHRITAEVDPVLEITEITDRVTKSGGPGSSLEHPKGSRHPCSSTCWAPKGA